VARAEEVFKLKAVVRGGSRRCMAGPTETFRIGSTPGEPMPIHGELSTGRLVTDRSLGPPSLCEFSCWHPTQRSPSRTSRHTRGRPNGLFVLDGEVEPCRVSLERRLTSMPGCGQDATLDFGTSLALPRIRAQDKNRG